MWFNKKKKETGKEDVIFSEKWMREWRESINNSSDYRKKGKSWNAPLILKFDPVPDHLEKQNAIGFFLNLQYGECTEMKFAEKSDLVRTDLILTADENSWVRLIEEKKDPTIMIMKGELKLEKGSLVLLSTQRKAAKALVETAPVYRHQVNKKTELSTERRVPVRKKHNHFVTTKKGLDFESFPMQLFQKAKKLGIWNPADIDFSVDKNQWKKLTADEKTILIHLSSLFMAGEEAVTLDLLPLIQTISGEGRLEEEIYLTSFLWEEAKHTEFFSRFVAEVMDSRPDFESFHGTFYKKLFYKKLPADLNRLYRDQSANAQLKAAGTYNMIVEGTLAETGYEAYYKMLSEHNMLPGLRMGITHLKQDESRHIAYGLFLINRLLSEDPGLRVDFEKHLEEGLNDATNIIHEIFEPYEQVPFGLEKEWFLDYAIRQFQYRMKKLGL
jgi:ribonucleotide reductase beta subunit family protein with ferritin-like domain/putative sterol carrier protein